jgi:hypothetical protein
LNTTKTAETGTTSSNITITGHGLSVGDRIYNSTRGVVSKVSVVVDANNITISTPISSQTTGDTIKTYKTSIVDISKEAIVVIANAVSGNKYSIDYYLDESTSTIPTTLYSYSQNLRSVVDQNSKSIVTIEQLVRQLFIQG